MVSFELQCVPGYEILGELGRGDMGVTYRARRSGGQPSDGEQIVALKVVLAGEPLSDQELTWFEQEAWAVARLRHPRIVDILDVGRSQGRPFYAMELIDGDSLAVRLQGEPASPRWSAELVERMARAVDAAHQAGILHCDLKPANVLLAPSDQPKVKDFSLARHLSRPNSQRSTAARLPGTPQYLAPEEVAGRMVQVSPRTDVYSLGAILYHLLTGQSPFQSADDAETRRRILRHDARAPRQLNPLVPDDLETIALKCLEKDPARRLASAAMLGDELGRYLAGEPILSRPPSRLYRMYRWLGGNGG